MLADIYNTKMNLSSNNSSLKNLYTILEIIEEQISINIKLKELYSAPDYTLLELNIIQGITSKAIPLTSSIRKLIKLISISIHMQLFKWSTIWKQMVSSAVIAGAPIPLLSFPQVEIEEMYTSLASSLSSYSNNFINEKCIDCSIPVTKLFESISELTRLLFMENIIHG